VMRRTEWALVAAGFLGFGLAALGHYAIGPRWRLARSYRMASYRAIQARPGKTCQRRKGCTQHSAARPLPKKFRRSRRGGHYLGGRRREPWSSGCWRLLQHRRRPAAGSDCHSVAPWKSNANQTEAGKSRIARSQQGAALYKRTLLAPGDRGEIMIVIPLTSR
jgi:hypothetical protein